MEIILIIAGAALLYYLQNLIYKKYWDRGLSVSLRFSDATCTEGGKNSLIEVITNRNWLPLPVLRVRFKSGKYLRFAGSENVSVSDGSYKNDIFSAMFYQRITRTIPFDCLRRGLYRVDTVNLVSYNLFMSSPLVKDVPCGTSFLVYPRGVDASRIAAPFNKMIGSVLTKRFSMEDPFEFRAIREYSKSDPMKSINWKASAKTGALKVNVHNYTSRQEACILLNFQSDTAFIDDALYEEAIRIANSLSHLFIKAGVPTGLVSNGTDVESHELCHVACGSGESHITTIKTALARICYDGSLADFSELLANLRASQSDDTLYVLLSFSCKKQLQAEFAQLCNGKDGCLWIVPHRAGERDLPAPSVNYDIHGWEVV